MFITIEINFTSLKGVKGETENCMRQGYTPFWNITHCQEVLEDGTARLY
jgi:hypothetical protein